MHLSKQTSLFAGAAAVLMTGGAFADGNNQDDLRARIAELEKRNSALEDTVRQVMSTQSEQWLTEQRAGEIRGIVQDVLADVDMRSSMLQGGGGAGYNNGFNITSGDGNFSLTINGHAQTRFVYNDKGDPPPPEGGSPLPADIDSDRWGFEMKRTRLSFGGYVMDPSWQYYIRGGFGSGDSQWDEDPLSTTPWVVVGPTGNPDMGKFSLLEAFITKDMGNGMSWVFGQYKLPFLTEQIHDGGPQQLGAERSLLAYSYGKGRTQGIMLNYVGDNWRWSGAFSDGHNLGNTRWDNVGTEFAFTAAFDYLFNGSFDQFDDGFHSRPGSQAGQMLHVALHYEEGEDDEPEFGEEYDILELTADIQVEYDGWSAFFALMYEDWSSGSSSDDRWGFVAQAEYFFNDNTAVFGRWEYDDGWNGEPDFSILTFGVNKFYGDHVRATVDLLYALDPVENFYGSHLAMVGLRPDQGGEDGQIALRGQLELTF